MRFYLEFDYQRISIILTICFSSRILEKVAHHTFHLVEGLCLHLVRRKQEGCSENVSGAICYHGSRRYMARSLVQFLLWGIVHGIILILHRILSRTRQNIQLKERFTRTHFLISWFVTQYLVFFTWLIFRVQDTALLFSSMKSFLLFGDFGIMDTYRSLPDVKFLTFLFILMFIAAHFLGSKYGCLRTRLSEQKLLPYSVIIGFMFTAIFILRPAEISTFIYFQF